MVGVAAQKLVHRWFAKVNLLWNSITRWKRKPLRLCDLIKMVDLAVAADVDKREVIPETPSCLSSSLASLKHVLYRAEHPWSQLCYFTKFKVLEEVISCRKWLREGLSLLFAEPLIFIDRDGSRREIEGRATPDENESDVILWSDTDLYTRFKPRHLPIYPQSDRLIGVSRTSLASKGATTFLTETTNETEGSESTDMKTKTNNSSHRFLDRDGNLTDYGKKELQACGRRYKELSVEQIVELLPRSARKIPKNVVRAHIAVSHREKK